MESLYSFFWPIKKEELGKFVPLSLILFLTIFCYNTLKALKDSLIVPSIGAEALSFIKFYFVVPSAVLVVVLYINLSNKLRFNQIYFYIASFYVCFFMLFGFVLYPYQDYFHPDINTVSNLINREINFFSLKIKMFHFKWFIMLYGKWLYVVFYVLAELWSSTMTFLLFWQFSNRIIITSQAKRLYPMINLFGSSGNVASGVTIKSLSVFQGIFGAEFKLLFSLQFLLTVMSFAAILVLIVFKYINEQVIKDSKIDDKITSKETAALNKKSSFGESLQVIFSSKYLGHIVILVLSYGIAINLLEGPWKAKVKELYPDAESYLHFMGHVNQWNGTVAIILSLLGAFIMKKYSWFSAAVITPILIFITGIGFFTMVVFENSFYVFLSTFFTLSVSPLFLAVLLGAMQNVLSKASKYSLFDSTKEMTFIPIEEELRSKGKAAVDVVGSRFAKSGGALIQSLLFIFFPAATYVSISPFLMFIFAIVAIIWVINLKALNKKYLYYIQKENS
jgi:ATP:ADP antiporter, AAA family